MLQPEAQTFVWFHIQPLSILQPYLHAPASAPASGRHALEQHRCKIACFTSHHATALQPSWVLASFPENICDQSDQTRRSLHSLAVFVLNRWCQNPAWNVLLYKLRPLHWIMYESYSCSPVILVTDISESGDLSLVTLRAVFLPWHREKALAIDSHSFWLQYSVTLREHDSTAWRGLYWILFSRQVERLSKNTQPKDSAEDYKLQDCKCSILQHWQKTPAGTY